MPRVGILTFWHETNTYSPRPATRAAFEQFELLEGGDVLERHAGTGSVLGGFLSASDWATVVPLFAAGAWPSGPAPAPVAQELLGRVRAQLLAAGPLDGVLLDLHGAMVADEHEDIEAEVLAVVQTLQPRAATVAVLDLHGNPSARFTRRCDAIVGYATYPHVDMHERGRESSALMRRLLDGESLATWMVKLPLLTTPLAQGTDAQPMHGLLEAAARRAVAAGDVRVSLLPGFPYSDVPRAGFSVLGVGERDRRPAVEAVLHAVADDVIAAAPDFAIRRPSPREAIEQAQRASGPIVVADVGDNVGGGGPGDGTVLLAELLRQDVEDFVVTIADPDVVRDARACGTDGSLRVRLGAKLDALHGSPVEAEACVRRLHDGTYRAGGSWRTGQQFSMGPTAVLGIGRGTALVTSLPTPPFHAEQLTTSGIDPRSANVIALKGALAWRAPYAELIAGAVEADTPGVCPLDPGALPRRTGVAVEPAAAAAGQPAPR